MIEPQLCPFCGAKPFVIKRTTGETVVECLTRTCPMSGRYIAIEDWRLRPIEDALAAENARLKQLLDRAAVVLLDVDARINSGILRDKVKLMVDEIVAINAPPDQP